MTFLNFRLNACPICLICLDCQNIYGQDCICQARVVIWKRKKVERDYVVDFCHRPLTQKGATNQKSPLDLEFVNWGFANISSNIDFSPIPNNVNICQRCMMEYRGKKNDSINKQFIPNNLISVKENCIAVRDHIVVKEDCIIVKENSIDFSVDSAALKSNVLPAPSSLPNDVQSMSKISKPDLRYIPLVCFDKLKQPRKKLDGAIDIPYDLNNLTTFGQIEEEILSPDHFNLKSSDSIVAFVAEWKKNKKMQLCVYSERQYKRKEIIYGSSMVEDDDIEEPVSKKLRTSESDSGSPLNITKLEIYKNLPKCEYYLQGCLIAEDGRHFKLNNEMIIIWARAILSKINGVDATHPPLTKLFDKINYRYPNSKRPLEDHNNIISTDDSPIETPILSKKIKPNLATVHLKKKSPYKSNIQITKGMTFQDLIKYVFPMGPPEGKRFVIKSSLNTDGKTFLSEQII
ncbi:hypothetical protein RhiirA1_461176 [Rhizophagus irregularis]|uniref:Uncharacterized protein n=2 Tax=Rhizophagus irregularis TaxID=588596 RepID=A0A2I1EB37_9GLOM|nr:hypothetical protein RhiirA1_461176 [Rhizophagus irregularis]PKY19329.1 hypothetical protein RhiirB3_432364 [Rhizophagus irregularis]CAB4494689.1 unnamed protein product [Rhizophagus irregularis]